MTFSFGLSVITQSAVPETCSNFAVLQSSGPVSRQSEAADRRENRRFQVDSEKIRPRPIAAEPLFSGRMTMVPVDLEMDDAATPRHRFEMDSGRIHLTAPSPNSPSGPAQAPGRR